LVQVLLPSALDELDDVHVASHSVLDTLSPQAVPPMEFGLTHAALLETSEASAAEPSPEFHEDIVSGYRPV
jgi:hypothetical protein